MADLTATLQYLKRVPLFAALPAQDLEFVARSVRERVYEPGAVIVRQGEPGMGFFLIADGRVEVSRDGRRLREQGPGEFFGEMALLEERARTATVTAITRTRCLQLVRWDFRALLQEHPGLAIRILEVVVRRLRESPPPPDAD
jgi:CRP-like cAMP-binding protein